jgi:RNA polymerase sigma-70 factor (ECF subfamily)
MEADLARQRHVVDAFFAASRGGNMHALLAVLDPEAVFRPDAVAARMGSVGEIRGRVDVAKTFNGRAQAARLAVIDGAVGAIVVIGGQLRIALHFTVNEDGMVTTIDAMADPQQLRRLDIVLIEP